MLTSFFSKLSHVTLLMTFMSRPMEGRAGWLYFLVRRFNLALRLLSETFQVRGTQTVLFRCDTMFVLDVLGNDLAVYTLVD